MVDEFNVGIVLTIVTMASPMLVYFVLAGLPSATAVNQISGGPELQIQRAGAQVQSSNLG